MKESISEQIERELVEDVIRPSITTNTLHFDILIRNLKKYYESKGRQCFPNRTNWKKLIIESI